MVPRMVTAPAMVAALLAPGGFTPAATRMPGPGDRAPGSAVVTVVASEFRFTVPQTLPAGRTTFRLVNHGQQVHHLTLIHLVQGKTLTDLRAALAKPGPPPSWMIPVGGPNAVDPGGSSEAVVELQPGRYVLGCFVPGPDGVPHMMKGMLQELTVTPAEARAAPEPKPDMTVRLVNYAFTFSGRLTAGEHRLQVRNADTQLHEIVLFRLNPGKTAKDLLSWARAMKGPPPGSFEGGASPLAPGAQNDIVVNVRRGRYALVCFVEDARDGKPHFMHGMVQELEVD